ncbi:protein SAR DEFICIENT 4 [Typha latifolia]|uniref:protein SAR DEFICIENT 4 n=1 Tax=Typha latifolia TaxID=4733 RepID=UPI003C2EE48F
MATPPSPPAQPFVYLDSSTLHSLLPPQTLIPHFHSTLPSVSSSIHSPPRLSYPLPVPSSLLLLMPSWSSHPSLPYLGVKLLTSFPSSSSHGGGVHGSYSLFHSLSGRPLASLDGSALTLLRTSAVSALASLLLSRPSPSVLLLAGAGSLAPYLVAAHRAARPSINRIILWNRTPKKAQELAHLLQEQETHRGGDATFEHAELLDDVVPLSDIVSCATSSLDPLIKGELLKRGAHLDLVGSFTPAMRECDDEALMRGRVFVDFETAMEEAGELVGAFKRGVMTREDVAGTLVELAGGKKVGRRDEEELTVFKSVGTAVVDILAAQLAYEAYMKR